MSDAEDWESQNGWMDELAPPPDTNSALPALPDAPSVHYCLPPFWSFMWAG